MASKDKETERLFALRDAWMEEARNISNFTALSTFAASLLDREHDYSSIVYAIAAIAVGAVQAANRHRHGGITGFQASCVVWEFIYGGGYWGTRDRQPMKVVKFDEMLYPQYRSSFAATITPDTWSYLQKEAARCLKSKEGACASVCAHWQSIVDGTVPFGYTVQEGD